MIWRFHTFVGILVRQQDENSTLAGAIMTYSKCCIEHAGDAHVLQVAQWWEPQVHVTVALCKPQEPIRFEQNGSRFQNSSRHSRVMWKLEGVETIARQAIEDCPTTGAT